MPQAIQFNYSNLAPHVKQVLQQTLGGERLIVTEEGYLGRVHVKIVSDQFNGKGERDKQNFVWDILNTELREEAQAVTFVACYGTDEL